MTFALLDLRDDVMVAKGNHTVAGVKGKDDYNTLQESFANVFKEINKLNSEKKIEVNGRDIKLEFFLGGDCKFILLMMGLKAATSYYACVWCKVKAATSYYACIWCKVHKDNMWKTTFLLDHYESSALKRTIKEISEMSKKKREGNILSGEHTPLLMIELDHVILDELHLLLRILDVLIENLIEDVYSGTKRKIEIRKKARKKIPI